MSLKAYDPGVQIALVHDSSAISHLSKEEKNLFDQFIIADPQDYTIDGKTQYQRVKLCLDKYTPFDGSLYIDVDTIWFPKKKISDLLQNLEEFDFYIGKNGEYNPASRTGTGQNYTYWGRQHLIIRYHKLRNTLPQTVSGVFWFKKSVFSAEVFARAQAIYTDRMAPCVKWANGKPDEYCFNVALSEMAYSQKDAHFVYFDKINGQIDRERIFNNFWGMAAGGNKLAPKVADFYNDLVLMYQSAFSDTIKEKRLHVDKVSVIKERRIF